MKLNIHEFELKLKDTFKTAHSKRDVQQSVVVELQSDGKTGFGEATVNTYYGITLESIKQALKKAESTLAKLTLTTPEELNEILVKSGIDSNFALCAVDEAAYDLYGKIHGVPTYEYINTDLSTLPLSNYTIGIDSIDKMVAKMNARPWPVYKIKLGTPNDLEIVRALRERTESLFRVDANCGWTAEETIKNSRELAKLGVEYIEQPLAPTDWDGMAWVFQESELPVLADESCVDESDVERCHHYFHGINIKLTKCGGLTPARRMIQKARDLNMKVMAGCMTESSVGISAVAQLLPLLDYADMDGPLLIENDPARGVTFNEGQAEFPKTNGNGVELI